MSERSPQVGSREGPPPDPAPLANANALGADLIQALDRIEGLPALPEVVTRVLALADDPDSSARDVADMVSGDQATAAAVLRLVNAPFFGLGRKISSIQHAVLLLGVRTVRNLVLSAVLVKSFGESSRDRRLDRGRLWRHAVACAAGSRMLSRRLGGEDPEEAFLGGLVHDMGIVVLDQFFHDGFRQVADLAIGMNMPLTDAEREVFGRDHAFVGRQLARRWNFPAAVAEAIGCHQDPARARLNPRLAAIVHLTDWLETAPSAAARAGDPSVAPDGATGDPAAGPAVATSELCGVEPTGSGADDRPAQRPAERPAPADEESLDPFCAPGSLDPAALEVLGLGFPDLEPLHIAVAEERSRTATLMSVLA